MSVWAGLGTAFAHAGAEYTDPSTTLSVLNELWSLGVRKIRVNIPVYTTDTSNTTFRNQLRAVCTTALDMGFYVMWGYTVTGGTVLSDSTMRGAYHDALVSMATWAETLNNKANFEINLGNEDDDQVNGTDCTTAQYQAYVRGTLADDVKTAAPSITVSYVTDISFNANWQSGGLGSLDRFGLNVYASDSLFKSHIISLNRVFGSNCFIGEFNSSDNGYNDYSDELDHATALRDRLEFIKKWVPSAYIFSYTMAGGAQQFALKLTNGTLRRAVSSIMSSRINTVSQGF